MGLFDSIFGGQESQDYTPADAYAGILLAASASDGIIADEEAGTLFQGLSRMKLFENFNGQRYNSMVNRVLGQIKREGVESVLRRCCEKLPKPLHETVFANACDIVLADGVVEPEEKQFLEDLRRMLNINGDHALTIVQVMIIKNKG
jgi:tellurite resistance protein